VSRQRVALQPPDPSRDYSVFPRVALTQGTSVYRVHRKGLGPWWFCSCQDCRFDLNDPRGTCYLATDPMTAVLEAFGNDLDSGFLPETAIQDRCVRRMPLPADYDLADLASRRCVGFDVTSEIGDITPYDLPLVWATHLDSSGFDGLRWSTRFDPAPSANGVAVYGEAGERSKWRRGRASNIGAKFRRRLKDECNVEVLPVPHSRALRVVR
jgi:hypothetical protein